MHIVHPPITVPPSGAINSKRSDFGYSPQDFIVLSVGRLIQRKGQFRMIQSIRNLIDDIPSIKYAIVGDGPDKDRIVEEIAWRDIQDRVTIYSHIDDPVLHDFYNLSDLFVLPTAFIPPNDVEGFGIVFAEANAHGKPVIGGNSGGVPDTIIHGRTGYLVDPSSPEELEARILLFFTHPDLCHHMGEEGQKHVLSDFNGVHSDRLLRLFHYEK